MITPSPFHVTADDMWDILSAAQTLGVLAAQPSHILHWYQDAATKLNSTLQIRYTAFLNAPTFFPPSAPPANPTPAPGAPTPPYQYTQPTVVPYREPAKPTNPKVNEARVLELYNQGKGEMDLLKMFANMSYEDLKRIIGKK